MNAKEIMAMIKASGKPHYVYILSKPAGEPFYVGVGTWRRVLDHAIFAKRSKLDSHKLRVIRKLWRGGLEISYSIHAWFDDRKSAELAEVALIENIGRRCDRLGPLTNVTSGGEGASDLSDETMALRSRRAKEAWAERDKIKSMAHLNDPEVRRRAVASRLGKKRGPYNWVNKAGPKEDGRKRLSEILKADPVSRRPGIGDKISAALRARSSRAV